MVMDSPALPILAFMPYELVDTEVANRETGRSPSIGAHGYGLTMEKNLTDQLADQLAQAARALHGDIFPPSRPRSFFDEIDELNGKVVAPEGIEQWAYEAALKEIEEFAPTTYVPLKYIHFPPGWLAWWERIPWYWYAGAAGGTVGALFGWWVS